jgi:UDP-glucose 4-epimerase
MSWLVTGGAGYIGSHVVHELLSINQKVIVYDNLTTGKPSRLPEGVTLTIGDICDIDMVSNILEKGKIQGVINLAALKSVENSYINPVEYERVNVQGVDALLQSCVNFGVEYFLQSSTAAVYGDVMQAVVNEETPTKPVSPYGETKLMAERKVENFVHLGHGKATSLRYFNVIGAGSKKLRDDSESNLLPIVLKSISEGRPPKIFGNDYATKDGTCIRDYIHVVDVARAHVKALQRLTSRKLPSRINVGSGTGYSVLEVVSEILSVKKSSLKPEFANRRQGDIASLIASTELAQSVLDFSAQLSLRSMIESSIE